MKNLKPISLTLNALMCIAAPLQGEVLIDDHFDDNTVTGWASLGNTLGAIHAIIEEGTTLTSEVVATQSNLNTNRGIISDAFFNPLSDPSGFSMTFEVASQGVPGPGVNGLFLGLTTSNTLFFRTEGVSNFGLVFFGFESRTQSQGGVSLVTNDIGTGGSATEGLILDTNPFSIELSSFQDGFTAVVSADSTGWSFEVSDINGQDGLPTTITNSGTWADANTDFASVFGGEPAWFIIASNQGAVSSNTHTVVYDRIALTTGGTGESALQITSIEPNLEGEDPSVTLRWDSVSGANYAIDYSISLEADSWVEITDNIPASENLTEFTHAFLPGSPDLANEPQLFYRVRLAP